MSDLKSKFSYQVLYALTQIIFPLITYPYLTRTIGPEGLGKVAFIEYSTGLVITLAAFGVSFYGVREVAKVRHLTTERGLLFSQLFTLQFWASLLSVCIFLLFIYITKNSLEYKELLVLGCINILLLPLIAEWYMQGTESFKYITIRNLILRSAGVAAILTLVKDKDDFIIYYGIIISIQVALAAFSLIKVKLSNVRIATFESIKPHIRPLSYFFVTTSLISIYVFFDVIILGNFTTEEHVGYYTTALKLIKLSLLIILSMNAVLFPRISSLYAQKNFEKIKSLIQQALQFIILVTLPIGFMFFLFAHEIILLLAGPAFAPSVKLVKILSILPLIISFSNLFVYQILVPFSKERVIFFSVAITCISSIILHMVFANIMLEEGTAVATILTESIITLFTAYFSLRTLKFHFPVKVFFQSIAALLPMVFIYKASCTFLTNSLFILLVNCIFGLLFYVLLQLLLFRNLIFIQLWWQLKLFSKKHG